MRRDRCLDKLRVEVEREVGSMSTKIGVAPTWATAFATAIKANEGTSTSAPAPMPRDQQSKMQPCGAGAHRHRVLDPVVGRHCSLEGSQLRAESQYLVRSTAVTASISACVISGADSGIGRLMRFLCRQRCNRICRLHWRPDRHGRFHQQSLQRNLRKHAEQSLLTLCHRRRDSSCRGGRCGTQD